MHISLARPLGRALLVGATALACLPGLALAASPSGDVVARDAYSTTTQDGDAFRTRTFPEPVNFKADDGTWEPINRSLVRESDGTVHPVAVDGDAAIPSSISRPVVIEHDGLRLSFDLRGASGGRDLAATKADFDDALSGVDLSYKARSNGLKETLTLADKNAPRSFTYDVAGDPGLSAAIGADGQLVFTDAGGAERFRVSAPLAWDSAEPKDFANALDLSVTKVSDGRWTLTMRVDDAWLDDPARVFPATLDPDYYWVDAALRFHGASQDCHLASNDFANYYYCAANVIQVGQYNRYFRGNFKFDVASAIPKYATATKATFLLWQPQSTPKGPANMRLRTLTRDWDNTATWNQAKKNVQSWTTPGGDVSTDPSLIGPPTTVGPQNYWYYWDTPLAAVNGWIKGTLPNYGLQLSTDPGSPTTTAYGFTSTDGDQALWPALDVTWKPDTTAPTGVVPAPGDAGAADQDYLGGSQAGTINASAQDEASGIKKLELLRDNDLLVSSANINCPGDICPLAASAALGFDTTGWTEGAHTFKLRATDWAGNVNTTSAWNIYVDRSAPVLQQAPYAFRDDNDVVFGWDADDPNLADGRGGSGATIDGFRVQTAGTWSAWTDVNDSGYSIVNAGSSFLVQLRSRDDVGNEATFAEQTVAVGAVDGSPFTGSEPTYPTVPAVGDCEAHFGPGVCVEPEEPATLFAAAAQSVALDTTANPEWGLAEPDSFFTENAEAQAGANTAAAVTVKPSFASVDGRALMTNPASTSKDGVIRMLVPFNIMRIPDPADTRPVPFTEKTPLPLASNKRLRALTRLLAAAKANGWRVMITFERGCALDRAVVSCNNDGSPEERAAQEVPPPKGWVNGAAMDIAKLTNGVGGPKIGDVVKWFGVWNEPSHFNQPFHIKSKTSNAGTNIKRGGDQVGGLIKLTEELTNTNNGVCKVLRYCRIVTAEVELLARGRPTAANAYANQYVDGVKASKKVDKPRLGFWGMHDYSEVQRAFWTDTAPVRTSSLAKWMKRLPRDAKVWLPEIGVFADAADDGDPDFVPDGDPKTPDPGQLFEQGDRTNQARHLFRKLGRIKVRSNNASIARANYYQFCRGSDAFDTSVYQRDPPLSGTATDCSAGAVKRDSDDLGHVYDELRLAIDRGW